MTDQHEINCPWDGYSFVKLLGQGTYGSVYLFKREEYGNTYFSAIKHISIPVDYSQIDEIYTKEMAKDDATLKTYYSRQLESLTNEININMELRGHTNFVFYDDHQIIPHKDGHGYDIYIKMEYLTNLSDYLPQHALSLADVLHLGEDICAALSVIQKRKLIHRDIKPENIFINENGFFKLGDFGIVRTLDESTSKMSARGALQFMAPELIHYEKSDYRVDLYSLGLVLYRLLNGNRAPFLPPHPMTVTHLEYNKAQDMRMRGVELPPPANADSKLSAIILKACAYNADQRWLNAEQMKEKLLEYDQSLSKKVKQTIVLDIGGKAKEPEELEESWESEESDLPDTVSVDINDAEMGIPEKIQRFFSDARDYLLFSWQRINKYGWKLTSAIAALAAVIGLLVFLLVINLRTLPVDDPTPLASEPPQITVEPEPIESEPPQITTPKNDPIQIEIETPHIIVPPITVVFRDPVIGSTISKQLQKEPGDIFPEDLDAITELDIETGSVELLEDLNILPKLKILRLKKQPLPDHSLLGRLENLEVLNLSGCSLTDASFIGNLVSLTHLDISQNDLTDIGFVSQLVHLKYLNISNNTVSDLTPLRKLKELIKLEAENNPVLDWSIADHIPDVTGTPKPPPPEPPPPEPPPPKPTPPKNPAPTPPAPTPRRTPTPAPTPAPEPEPEPEIIQAPPPSIPVKEIKLNRSSLLLDIGGSAKLSATISPNDATDKTLVWSSSNPSIATVDSAGNVKAVGNGTTSITVSCGGQTARCSVTVN